jgi:hypothetical protein
MYYEYNSFIVIFTTLKAAVLIFYFITHSWITLHRACSSKLGYFLRLIMAHESLDLPKKLPSYQMDQRNITKILLATSHISSRLFLTSQVIPFPTTYTYCRSCQLDMMLSLHQVSSPHLNKWERSSLFSPEPLPPLVTLISVTILQLGRLIDCHNLTGYTLMTGGSLDVTPH